MKHTKLRLKETIFSLARLPALPALLIAHIALLASYSQAIALPLPRPEIPAIERDVHMSEIRPGQTRPQYTRPTIPALQTTADGRIGLGSKSQAENGLMSFRLLVPEKIKQPFLVSPVGTGTDILSHPNQLASVEQSFEIDDLPGSSAVTHSTLCDPAFDPESSVKNPRACGVGNADDCYDIVMIRSELERGSSPSLRKILGIPFTIRVTNPKTVDARIAQVDRSGPVAESKYHTINQFFEPMTTSDGRLLVGRVNTLSQFTWEDSAGISRTTKSDMVYFTNDNPDNFEACDVTQWDKVYPITHAPYDTTINQRYGFAKQLWRDARGTVLSDGVNLGTYPWIDKDGDNISFTTLGTSLYDLQGEAEDPDLDPQCATSSCKPNVDSESFGPFNGRVILGSWTQGKMVLLDNLLNNIDFLTIGDDAGHRSIQLYEPGFSGDGRARIGNGRDSDHRLLPVASSGNTTFFDSNEHRFNYLPNMRPITPADVTWLMSSGRGTDEVPFDDYMNPNTLIFANMAQLVRINSTGGRRIQAGQVQNAAGSGRVTLINPNNPLEGSRIKNSEWRIPTHGEILGNDSRIEPIAMGGIHGKGFWLDGNDDGLAFRIPSQTRSIADASWYYGLYVDARGSQIGDHALIHYPDGSEIRLRDANTLVYTDTDGTEVSTYEIDEPVSVHQWRHYGFQVSRENNRTRVVTYLNGYQVDSFVHNGEILQLQEAGEITVGESPRVEDLRGWIDEFKVVSEQVNPEVACNHASGTLAGISGSVSDHWNMWGDVVPAESHIAISNRLNASNKPSFSRFVCYHDYDRDYAAHLQNIPAGMTGIRESINFPEGPLFHDRPRPDSSNNSFCLSCHTSDGVDGLNLEALAFDGSVNAATDPRRQPMQPDPKVYGNIPANWLGNGLPGQRIVTDDRGYLIDYLLLLSMDGESVTDSSSSEGSTETNTVVDNSTSGTENNSTSTEGSPETGTVVDNSTSDTESNSTSTEGSPETGTVVDNSISDTEGGTETITIVESSTSSSTNVSSITPADSSTTSGTNVSGGAISPGLLLMLAFAPMIRSRRFIRVMRKEVSSI